MAIPDPILEAQARRLKARHQVRQEWANLDHIRLARSYQEYVEEKKRDNERPLPKAEWEKFQGKGKSESKGLKSQPKSDRAKAFLSKANSVMSKAFEAASHKVKTFIADPVERKKMTREMGRSVKKNAPRAAKAMWNGFKGEAKAIAVDAPSILFKMAKERRKPTKKELHTLYGVGVYAAGTALAFSGATPLLAAAKAFGHSITLHATFKAIHTVADEIFLGTEAVESVALAGGLGDKLPVMTSDIPGLNHIWDFMAETASQVTKLPMLVAAEGKEPEGEEEKFLYDLMQRIYEEAGKVFENLTDEDIEAIMAHGVDAPSGSKSAAYFNSKEDRFLSYLKNRTCEPTALSQDVPTLSMPEVFVGHTGQNRSLENEVSGLLQPNPFVRSRVAQTPISPRSSVGSITMPGTDTGTPQSDFAPPTGKGGSTRPGTGSLRLTASKSSNTGTSWNNSLAGLSSQERPSTILMDSGPTTGPRTSNSGRGTSQPGSESKTRSAGHERFSADMATSILRIAKKFELNVGDPVLYGKYKNKKGVITGFKTDEKSGDPIVVIEPVPKGRKQTKELKLFKVRFDEERADPAKRAAEMSNRASVALMRMLSDIARRLGAAQHVYVVGGAVRNFAIGEPIKDIDVVIDSVSLGKDSEWFANQVARAIPAKTQVVTDQYGVSKVFVLSPWELAGHQMQDPAQAAVEIANARKESYGGAAGKGYKPDTVEPATIEEDVRRREFTFNCMAGDTLIPTEKGILRIDQIASRDGGDYQDIRLTVAGQDGPSTAVGWQYSGFAPTLRVTTEWGHSFSCTHHHPVLVLRGHSHEWVQADQLEEGDLLCVPVRQVTRRTPLALDLPDPVQPKHGRFKEVCKPEVMTPELAFLIGCVLAEGSNTHKRVSFSNSDPALISRYVECFHATFGVQPSRNKVVEKGSVRVLRGVEFVANADGYDIYADSKAVVGWLEDLGLYCGGSKNGKSASHHKVVPWSILQADERSQGAFLAAYLEGDGTIRPDSGRITFCSASPHVRQQLQVLLGAHGILSKVKDRFVYINAVDSAILWEKIQPWMVTKGFDYTQRDNKARTRYGIPADYIRGFLAGRKQDTGSRAVYATDGDGFRTLPDVHEPVRKVQRLLHDAHARGDFDGFMASLKVISPDEFTKLRRLFDLGYQYVEVTSVENAGQQDVFDISMGEGVEPAFVANGVVVHNTLMWRLLDLAKGPDKAEIIDLTGCGVQDLKDRRMQCPSDPDKTFSDDPSRMLRAVKFIMKYGMKLTPDTEAAIRRNLPKLKRAPFEAIAVILEDTLLKDPGTAKKSLPVMKKLGLLDTVAEMIRENKAFQARMERWVTSKPMLFLFDLMDLGLPLGANVGFLSRDQQKRLRQIALGMPEGEPERLLEVLRQPGKVMDTRALIQEFGLQGREIAQMQKDVGVRLLLDNPTLAKNPRAFTDAVRHEFARRKTAGSPLVQLNIDLGEGQKVEKVIPSASLPYLIDNVQVRRVAGAWIRRRATRIRGRTRYLAMLDDAWEPVRVKLANPLLPQQFVQTLKALIEKVKYNEARGLGDTAELWLEWRELFQKGRQWGDYVIDHTAIPSGKAKAGEMGVRVFRTTYGRGKGPRPSIAAWLKKNERYFRVLEEATRWPERSEGDGIFKHGPFTVHNTVGASDKEIQTAKGIIDRALRALPKTDVPEMRQMAYGDLYLVGEIKRKRWAAWYMPQKDAIYLRPKISGISADDSALHLVHELTHRLWAKRLPALVKTAWSAHHFQMSNSRSALGRLPEAGEVLPKELVVNRKQVKVDSYDELGQAVLVDAKGGAPIGKVNRVKLREWMGNIEFVGKFPSIYASSDAEEHFCEAMAHKGMGSLSADNLAAFNQIVLGKGGPTQSVKVGLSAPPGWKTEKKPNGWVIYTNPTGTVRVQDTRRPHPERYQLLEWAQPTIVQDGKKVPRGRPQWLEHHGYSRLPEALAAGVKLTQRGRTASHHHIRNACPACGNVSTCRCRAPKTVETHDLCYDCRESAVRVAARYKNKKEVPKADGKGTTTVYEYSDKQVQHRNREKAKRVEKLRGSIHKLRAQVKKDLGAEDEKTRTVALVVGLMDHTYERVGNDESAKDGHYGVTGWQVKHITFGKGKATISYVGKSGVKHEKVVDDASLVSALKKATKGKGSNDRICDGEDCKVSASDVNAYLKPFDITAKDIRGFHANTEVQTRLKAIRSKGGKLPEDKKEREKKLKAEFKQALEEAAKAVGHEPSTLKSQYLVPGLEDEFLKGGQVSDKLDKRAMSLEEVRALKQEILAELGWRTATKTKGEKEEEEVERMSRPAPKKKPPRQDLRRNRMKDDDKDTDGQGADKDKDLSLNYKRVARLYHAAVLQDLGDLDLMRLAGDKQHKPGDVWKTEKGWRGKKKTPNQGGHFEGKTFPDREQAEAWVADPDPEGEDDQAPDEEGSRAPDEEGDQAPDGDSSDRPDPKAEARKERERHRNEVRRRGQNFDKSLDALVDTISPEMAEVLIDHLPSGDADKAAMAEAFDIHLHVLTEVYLDDDKGFSKKGLEDAAEVVSLFGSPPDPEKGEEDDAKLEAKRDAARKEKLKEFGEKTAKEKGEILARLHFATKVVADPTVVGGRSLAGRTDPEALRERGSEAARQYSRSSPEIRAMAAKNAMTALEGMAEDDPNRVELDAIVDGLAIAAGSKGETLEVDGKKLRPRASKGHQVLYDHLIKAGKQDILTGTMHDLYGPEGRAAVSEALDTMDDKELAAYGKTGHFSELASKLTDSKVGEEQKAFIRGFLKRQGIEDNGPVVHRGGRIRVGNRRREARSSVAGPHLQAPRGQGVG